MAIRTPWKDQVAGSATVERAMPWRTGRTDGTKHSVALTAVEVFVEDTIHRATYSVALTAVEYIAWRMDACTVPSVALTAARGVGLVWKAMKPSF